MRPRIVRNLPHVDLLSRRRRNSREFGAAAIAIAVIMLLSHASTASADPIVRITMEASLTGLERTTLDLGAPVTFSFDITPVVLPGAEGGGFRFEILRWTRPLSYTEEMRDAYWAEEMSPYPGYLTGRWDPERGSSLVQAEMVHGGPGYAIDRYLWSGEPSIYIPQAELDPYFHLIPMSLHSWENATGPSGSNNYFGGAAITEIAPVPEPSTIGLVIAGLASAAIRRRRRSH